MWRYYLRLWIWCNLWMIIWLFALPFKKKGQENCLTYALQRLATEEGYLVIRWARSAKYPLLVWPHFLFLAAKDHHQVQHLVPEKDQKTKTKIPVIWFDGKVRIGDPEEEFIDSEDNK